MAKMAAVRTVRACDISLLPLMVKSIYYQERKYHAESINLLGNKMLVIGPNSPKHKLYSFLTYKTADWQLLNSLLFWVLRAGKILATHVLVALCELPGWVDFFVVRPSFAYAATKPG